MMEKFEEILKVGGKSNSLGRADEVVELVLHDRKRLEELYDCIFSIDAWVRMRAIDSLEKVCRQHPEWLVPYIDKIQSELNRNTQPSIQWHLAQIYAQVSLTIGQKTIVIKWLQDLLSSTDIDWIVSANAMQALVKFTKEDSVPRDTTLLLLKIQQEHKSKSVVKKANKLLLEVSY
jgi:hypothetical protein